MLATTLWYTIAIALLAGMLLDAAAAFGRAGVHAAADHAIEPAMHDALADYQRQLQSTIASAASPLSPAAPFAGTTPSLGGYAAALAALPNPLERTIAPDPAASGPRFTLDYTVTPTTVAAPSCASASSSGADAIAWLQCAGFVQESRLSLHVMVHVRDAAGASVLAQRDAYVTLRLFAEPPYSAVVGRKDGAAADPAAADPLAPPPHEGDIGGDTVSGASPPPAGTWPAAGTLIHVRYECHDGAGSCANAAPPDPDGDLRAGARWSNGNQPAP